MPESVAELPSLGGSLAVSLLSLGFVCLIAYVALSWLARKGPRTRGAISVLARHQLEARRSLYVVKVAERTFLLGAAESGVSLVAELGHEDAQKVQADTHNLAGYGVVGSLRAAWLRRHARTSTSTSTLSESSTPGDL